MPPRPRFNGRGAVARGHGGGLPPGGDAGTIAPPPPPVRVINEGGMPGWQITLIALAAALVAAAAAVLLDRARTARKIDATV